MAGKLITLTEDSVAAIRALIAEDRRKYGGTLNRPGVEEELGQPPEVYVAKTPAEGISAMLDDVPGYADCDIYRILIDDDGNPYFHPISSLSKRVYNLKVGATGTGSTEGESGDIGGDSWITVIRDKFGSWLIAGGGGGRGDQTILAKITVFGTGTGEEPSPPYSWVEVECSEGFPEVVDGRIGFDNAEEYNGNADIAEGTIVRLHPCSQPEGTGSGEGGRYVFHHNPSGITAKESDETPTIEDADTIVFHSDDFVLTDLGDADAQVKTRGFTGTEQVQTDCVDSVPVFKDFEFRDGLLVSVTLVT